MAGRRGIAQITGISLTAAATTVLQLVAAANHAVKIVEVGFGAAGTDNTHAPILVELVRQTTAGTMTSLTLNKDDDSNGDTFDTTGQHTATAEPTTTDVVRAWRVHPQAGSLVVPFGDFGPMIGAGDRLGLRATAANAVTATAYLVFEE